jgi:DNA-binding XRE family transcriptional regulator
MSRANSDTVPVDKPDRSANFFWLMPLRAKYSASFIGRGLAQLNHDFQQSVNYPIVLASLITLNAAHDPPPQAAVTATQESAANLAVHREHRQAAGLTLTELAKAIGKTKGMVSQIENRQSAASSQTLEDIADFFGLAHVGLLFEPPVPKGWRRIASIVPKNNK